MRTSLTREHLALYSFQSVLSSFQPLAVSAPSLQNVGICLTLPAQTWPNMSPVLSINLIFVFLHKNLQSLRANPSTAVLRSN
jgi:hypothetical protein